MEKIVAFDVETPNYNNDRMCSIGICIIEHGEIVQSQHILVNPECDFDYRNIQIHGITPSDVAEAPTFPEIWEAIAPFFRENLVAAHNATFDLCVLRKVLQAYGICESLVYYVDTLTWTCQEKCSLKTPKIDFLCRGRFSSVVAVEL